MGRRPVCAVCRARWPANARWCGRCGALLDAVPGARRQGGHRRPRWIAAVSGVVAVAALVHVGGGIGIPPDRSALSGVAEVAVPRPADVAPSPPAPVAAPRVVCEPAGCETWRFTAPGRLEVVTSPEHATVLVTSRPGGSLHALAMDTGDERWRREVVANRRTQLLGDTVLLWTDDELIALDLADGALRWAIPAPLATHRVSYRMVRDGDAPGPSGRRVSAGWWVPGADPIAILVGFRGSTAREHVHALELTTGRALWGRSDATVMTVVGDRVVATVHPATGAADDANPGAVVALDARTGVEAWRLPLGSSTAVVVPAGEDQLAVVEPTEQRLVDAATGALLLATRGAADPGHTWWFVAAGGAPSVEVRDVPGEPAELRAHRPDGREAWRRVVPGPREATDPLEHGVHLEEGPDRTLVVRTVPPSGPIADGPAGDALLLTVDAATGRTRRLAVGLPSAGAGAELRWIVAEERGGLVGRSPGTGDPGWRVTAPGAPGEPAVVAVDPLLVTAGGDLLRLGPPER
jgi:outer membrane protein assembly factor BamB